MPRTVTRRLIKQKARHHPANRTLTPCRHTISGTISLRSQRFFSPFPRGTCSLSVVNWYLALRGGPRRFTRSFTCSVLLRNSWGLGKFRLRAFHPLWHVFPNVSSISRGSHDGALQPCRQAGSLGLPRVRSPLLTGSLSLSFPLVTEMFHFTRFYACRFKPAAMKKSSLGYPIRKSTGQSVFAAHRGLSQLITSFIVR